MPVLQLEPAGEHSPPTSAVADGAGKSDPAGVRQLDPRTIGLDRTVNAITGAIVATGHLLAVAILWLASGWPQWALLLFTAAWFPVTALLVWLAVWWPVIDYRYRRYHVTPTGIQIWSGVLWRTVISVPRSRVQHIDVTQGPIERSFGLATLSIYTAGSDYSKVDLPGLDHGVALALRDALLPQHDDPAV
jgi:uncharacterized protein